MVYVKFKRVNRPGQHTYFVGATMDDVVRDVVNCDIDFLTAPEQITDSEQVLQAAQRVPVSLGRNGPDTLAHGVTSVRQGVTRSYYLFTV